MAVSDNVSDCYLANWHVKNLFGKNETHWEGMRKRVFDLSFKAWLVISESGFVTNMCRAIDVDLDCIEDQTKVLSERTDVSHFLVLKLRPMAEY